MTQPFRAYPGDPLPPVRVTFRPSWGLRLWWFVYRTFCCYVVWGADCSFTDGGCCVHHPAWLWHLWRRWL